MNEMVDQLAELLLRHQWMLATAESCTGGWLSQVLTSVAGSSDWFERGFVTYSNLSKQELLGVSETSLQQQGAVSEQVVCEMADGAVRHSHAVVSVSITGIAGPTGGSTTKPVGTVWFGFAAPHMDTQAHCQHFSGDRQAIRQQAVEFALKKLVALLQAINIG